MDGENNGKPYEQIHDLGGFPRIFGSTPISSVFSYRAAPPSHQGLDFGHSKLSNNNYHQ